MALTRLADELQQTASHLAGYLLDQHRDDRLAPVTGSSLSAGAAVDRARDCLRQVHDTAGQLSSLLTDAELALLALQPRPAR